MITLELTHPIFGIIISENSFGFKDSSRDSIEQKWKHKYGKKFNECEVVATVHDKELKSSRKIVNIETGDIYDNMKEAAKEIGVTLSYISSHCRRVPLVINSGVKLKVKFQ